MTRRYSDDQVKSAVEKNRRLCDVLEHLGLRQAGGNFKTLNKLIKELKLDTCHFTTYQKNTYAESDILVKDSKVSGKVLKKYLLKNNLIPYKCSCGLSSSWNGLPLILQIEHKNGIHTDNRLENLIWLCPNCHSQTPTYCGKNKPKQKKPTHIKRAKKPIDYEEVKKVYEKEKSLIKVSKFFGVCTKTIKTNLKKKGVVFFRKKEKIIKLKCPTCQTIFQRAKNLTHFHLKNRSYTFCSRQCSGSYIRKKQLGMIVEEVKQIPIEDEIDS